jgi:hypothetical protein
VRAVGLPEQDWRPPRVVPPIDSQFVVVSFNICYGVLTRKECMHACPCHFLTWELRGRPCINL